MGLDNKVLYVEQQREEHNRKMNFLKNNLSKGDKAFVPKLKIENDKEIFVGKNIIIETDIPGKIGFKIVIGYKKDDRFIPLFEKKIESKTTEIFLDPNKLNNILEQNPGGIDLDVCIYGPNHQFGTNKGLCKINKNENFKIVKLKPFDTSKLKIELNPKGFEKLDNNVSERKKLNEWKNLDVQFGIKVLGLSGNLNPEMRYKLIIIGYDNLNNEILFENLIKNGWKIDINEIKVNEEYRVEANQFSEEKKIKINLTPPKENNLSVSELKFILYTELVLKKDNEDFKIKELYSIQKFKLQINKELKKAIKEEKESIDLIDKHLMDCRKQYSNLREFQKEIQTFINLLKNSDGDFKKDNNILKIDETIEDRLKKINFEIFKSTKPIDNIKKEIDKFENNLKKSNLIDNLKLKINIINQSLTDLEKNFNMKLLIENIKDNTKILIQEGQSHNQKFDIKLNKYIELINKENKKINLFVGNILHYGINLKDLKEKIQKIKEETENVAKVINKEVKYKPIKTGINDNKKYKEPENKPTSSPPEIKKYEPTGEKITDINEAQPFKIDKKNIPPKENITQGIPKTETQNKYNTKEEVFEAWSNELKNNKNNKSSIERINEKYKNQLEQFNFGCDNEKNGLYGHLADLFRSDSGIATEIATPEIGKYNYKDGYFIIITGLDNSGDLRVNYITGSEKIN